jgi:lipopolysaccharide export system permease protein
MNGEPKKIKFKIVTIYILKEFLPTFAITFLFFFFIFIINHILVYIKPLLEKNVPFDLVGMLILTILPLYILFCLPFGILLAVLMTMGRLSTDNEIVAFRACGFNMMQIFVPIFICSLVITFVGFIINDSILPYSIQEQRNTLRKIMYIKPTLDFKSKTVKPYAGKVIFTDIVKDNSIEGLVILEKKDGQMQIISTKKALISSPPDRKNAIMISMKDAMLQFENIDRPNEFNFGYSDDISYFISFIEDSDENRNISGNEMTTMQILNEIKKNKKEISDEKKIRQDNMTVLREETRSLEGSYADFLRGNIPENTYFDNMRKIDSNLTNIAALEKERQHNENLNFNLIEFYRKFALPLACIIFAIFAAPIGIYSRRAGFSIGFILGLFLSAVYWFSYYGGEFMGKRNVITPFLAMFSPNILFLIIGVYFLIKRLRE